NLQLCITFEFQRCNLHHILVLLQKLTQQLQKCFYDSSYKRLKKGCLSAFLHEQLSDSIYSQSHYHQREFCENNELAELAHNLDQHLLALNNHKQNKPQIIRMRLPKLKLKIDF